MNQEVADEVQNIPVTALKDTAIEGRLMLVAFHVVTHSMPLEDWQQACYLWTAGSQGKCGSTEHR